MVSTYRDYLYNFLKVILEEFKAAKKNLMKLDIPSSFPSANDFDEVFTLEIVENRRSSI